MQGSYQAEKSLGYAQSSAVDTATLVSSLTFGSSAVAGIPAGTSLFKIQAQTQAVRWRDDGVAPTAAIGYPLAVGTELVYTGANMGALQFISQTAGAILNVIAYR
jgi:hypothetical protein